MTEPALTESTMRRLMDEFTEKNRLQLTEVAEGLRQHVDGVAGELRNDLGALRTEVGGLRQHVDGVAGELRNDLGALRTEVGGIRQYVDEVAGDLRRHFDVLRRQFIRRKQRHE